jgi:penicillin-binding protein 1C
MQGTEPDPQTAQAPQLHPKIVYPVDGTAMALDPDIPQDRQKIFFDAKPQDGHLQWMLNGKVIGAANKTLAWSAQAGNYTLALVDQEQRVIDRVTFSVKGKRE